MRTEKKEEHLGEHSSHPLKSLAFLGSCLGIQVLLESSQFQAPGGDSQHPTCSSCQASGFWNPLPAQAGNSNSIFKAALVCWKLRCRVFLYEQGRDQA